MTNEQYDEATPKQIGDAVHIVALKIFHSSKFKRDKWHKIKCEGKEFDFLLSDRGWHVRNDDNEIISKEFDVSESVQFLLSSIYVDFGD